MDRQKTQLSRREMLAVFGLGGAGLAATCACSAIVATLLLRQRRPVVITVTETPIPTAEGPPVFPGLVRRADWGALPPDHDAREENGFFDAENNLYGWRVYDQPLASAYQTVVIHHSAMYNRDDPSTLLEIQEAHRQKRGWADVAYHYFVGKSGWVYEGRNIQARGAHVAGFNTGSAGVCLLGNFMEDAPTEAQITATLALVVWLANTLQLTHLAGHRDFNPETVCPGTNMLPYLEPMAAAAGLLLGTEGYIPPEETA